MVFSRCARTHTHSMSISLSRHSIVLPHSGAKRAALSEHAEQSQAKRYRNDHDVTPRAMPRTVQVCSLKTALEGYADLLVDLTGSVADDAAEFYVVYALDAAKTDPVEPLATFNDENGETGDGEEQRRALLRVNNFPDSEEGASDKVRRVVDAMVWCMEQLCDVSRPGNEVVVRVNCKSGQNRSAVVACRFAAVMWENAPNAPGPAVYNMFKRLCKADQQNMDPNDPKGTWPRFGVHGTGWAHAEIDGAAKRGENKYPQNGPRVVYDETYPQAELWRCGTLKTQGTDTQ